MLPVVTAVLGVVSALAARINPIALLGLISVEGYVAKFIVAKSPFLIRVSVDVGVGVVAYMLIVWGCAKLGI